MEIESIVWKCALNKIELIKVTSAEAVWFSRILFQFYLYTRQAVSHVFAL